MHGYLHDLGLLRDRRFTLLLTARTISVLGTSFAPVALAFGILALPGANATTLSVVLTAEALPMIVFMLFAGVIADRFPRHRVMMISEFMSALAFFALAAMMLSGWTPLPAMASAAAASGVAIAMLFPSLTGIIPKVGARRPAADRQRAARPGRQQLAGGGRGAGAAARSCCSAVGGRWP